MKLNLIQNNSEIKIEKKIYISILFALAIITACVPQEKKSTLNMIYAENKHELLITKIAHDHHLSKMFLKKMMETEHTIGMTIDQLIDTASRDSLMAIKINKKIVKYPKLMLMSVNHFIPVINSNQEMCDTFCDHLIKQNEISKTMNRKLREKNIN